MAVVCRNVVSMHARSDLSSEVVSQALWGERVGALAVAEPVALVQTPDGYRGWVRSDAVILLPTVTPAHEVALEERIVGELFARLMTEPRPDARGITLLTVGARVAVAAEPRADGYAPAALPAGGIGFIPAHALTNPPSADTHVSAEALVSSALRFVGIPYLWGGRSSFGMDCSGFVQMVYGLHGIGLPRDAHMQAAWPGAEPITRRSIQPGDLVFFGGDDPRGRGITHVGMALQPPEFIHAAGGIGVTISSLEEPPYSSIYRCAVRPTSDATRGRCGIR